MPGIISLDCQIDNQFYLELHIDKITLEIGAYFLKNILKNFLRDTGDIEKIKKDYSGFDWTCENICDMCVDDKNKRKNGL